MFIKLCSIKLPISYNRNLKSIIYCQFKTPLSIFNVVYTGGRHSLALTTDGKVFSWGEGDDGKLGHFSRWNCDKPRLIEALKSKRVRDIACGSSHSAAITSNGDLYTWGLGEYGRLGHGDNTTQLKPKQVCCWEASDLGFWM